MAEYCNKCKQKASFVTVQIEEHEGIKGRVIARYCTACGNLLSQTYPNGRVFTVSKQEVSNGTR